MRGRRGLLLGAGLGATLLSVLLVLAAPDGATAWSSTKCPAGEVEDLFTGVCVPEMAPSVIQMTTPAFGGLPEIDGVPCTGENSYECLGLAEQQIAQGPTPTPSATWTSSP